MRLAKLALAAAALAAAIVLLPAQTAAQTSAPPAAAAMPDTMAHKPIVPSKGLRILTYRKVNDTVNQATTSLTLLQIAAMPHKTVTVYNLHEKKNETYSGVSLADLLTNNGAPFNKDTQKFMLNSMVQAHGTDGYTVVYSTVEVYTPDYHTGDVIVADTLDGKPLTEDGLKLISSEDKHPMRWVHALDRVMVITFTPSQAPPASAPAPSPSH